MSNEKIKKAAWTILKLAVSGVAMYFVLRKINFSDIIREMQKINIGLLLLALIFQNLSQWMSSYRLKNVLKFISIDIRFWENLRIYYTGMFYNLILPGGVGGDGVKAIILKKNYKKSLKQIGASLLLDRITGLAGLFFLGGLALTACNFKTENVWVERLLLVSLVIVYPSFYLFTLAFFKTFKDGFLKISAMGMAVNLIQTISVLFLLFAMGVNTHLTDYLAVFYCATIALVIPLTIGGMGIRELIFMMAPTYLAVNVHTGVAFSLMFFVISSISALAGVFVKNTVTV